MRDTGIFVSFEERICGVKIQFFAVDFYKHT